MIAMIRVLIVDDHEVVRDGIKKIFDERPGTALFGEASTINDALKLAREQEWDVVVLDLERGTDRAPHETLSDREFEVMRLIASGKTVGEIAELLNLSDRTISTYRARLLEKMGMKTNAELTHYAIQNKLVE